MTFARIFRSFTEPPAVPCDESPSAYPIAEESLDTLDERLRDMREAVWPIAVDAAKTANSFERGVLPILPEHIATAFPLLRTDGHARNEGKSMTSSVQAVGVDSPTSH